ncbi:MAG TPA: Ig-like domain-containing protein, partial [Solirubrobacterales bacterium]|nr:Ig-like domain-containing protein [Solirubrobacterales bacterium]
MLLLATLAPAAARADTSFGCDAVFTIGVPAACEVEVRDARSTGASTPSGVVVFATSAPGSFIPEPRCSLRTKGPVQEHRASCRVEFTAALPLQSGLVRMEAHYNGDGVHEPTTNFTNFREVNLHPTATSVTCDAATLPAANAWLCRATVTTPSSEGEFGGVGVEFSASGPGTFSPGPGCSTLPQGAVTTTSCQVTYRPENLTTQPRQVTARYPGQSGHSPSEGSTTLDVRFTQAHLSCAPSALQVGDSTTCTVKITYDPLDPRTPTGPVRFSLAEPNEGTFGDGSICRLEAGSNEASCQISYAPAAAGTGRHEITATYDGDPIDEPSQASAVVRVGSIRYAAPGATGADPCDNRAQPCSLFTAASAEAPATTIAPGDEVVLAGGQYEDDKGLENKGDLGPKGEIVLPPGVSVRGTGAAPKTAIFATTPTSAGIVVAKGDHLSRVQIASLNSPSALVVKPGATVEGVFASTSAASAVSCELLGGTLIESACQSFGPGGTALGGALSGAARRTVVVRNLTANSFGPESFGIKYRAIGPSRVVADVLSTIAQGTAKDVVAEALSPAPHLPGTGGKVEIHLDHSDYATTSQVSDGGGGAATVTPAGSGANITAPPVLGDDHLHQELSSQTRDAGAADERSGTSDIDGQVRTLGPAPDIGADEAGPRSRTNLNCSPNKTHVGQTVTCTAEVSPVEALPPGPSSAPQGTVRFESTGAGSFGGEGVCTLTGDAGATSCQISYSPNEKGNHVVRAFYEGTNFDGSSGAFLLGVGATRYAAPFGVAADPCEDPQHPCSLFIAASTDARGTTLQSGDRVVVEPGQYSVDENDLGPNGVVVVRPGVEVSGVEVSAPQPLPEILFDTTATAGIVVPESATVSKLFLHGFKSRHPLIIERGGTAEDMISVVDEVGSIACKVETHGGVATLTNSVCRAAGGAAQSTALGDVAFNGERPGESGGTTLVRLRNVDAIATGPGSVGIGFTAESEVGSPKVTVDAKSVIAKGNTDPQKGNALDVVAQARHGSGGTATTVVEINLDHSDYQNVFIEPEAPTPNAIATITPVGQAGNITAAPQFVTEANPRHQLPTSPTINAGAVDAFSPVSDIDGKTRISGGVPDIGADEFEFITGTSVACPSGRVRPGERVTCTVTVQGVLNTVPTGKVSFESDNPGAFSSAEGEPTCTLEQAGPVESTCRISYEPTAAHDRIHKITATYAGDENYASSKGTAVIEVATIRYAAPGASGANPCTNAANPCPLSIAGTESGGARSGDEVILAPGTYSSGIRFASGVKVHGAFGKPRPLITSSVQTLSPLVQGAGGDKISHLEIATSGSDVALETGGVEGEDLIVRSSKPGGWACKGRGFLRDSVCLTTGARGIAVGDVVTGSVDGTFDVLRNVTAVSTGPESVGFRFASEGLFAFGSQTLVSHNVIARGVAKDVEASSLNAVSVHLQLDHSDYETTAATGTGTATVTDPGSEGNLKAPPQFAADGYHQLAGSPTVDAGAPDVRNGELDIDGQRREIAVNPDIGADELGLPTTTEVVCHPDKVVLGTTSTCTATVVNRTPGALSPPAGKVRFETDGPGGFGDANTCILTGSSETASCKIVYQPTAVGAAPHQVTASYLGDETFEPSSDRTRILVLSGKTRFAAPGGHGSDPCADPTEPCSLFLAASSDASGTTIKPGDEVILAPGTYREAAGELGPGGALSIAPTVFLHGRGGAPRPLIELGTTQGVVHVEAGDVVSFLEVDSAAAATNLTVTNGVADNVISRSSAPGAIACTQRSGVLRDSVCLTTGPQAAAAGLDVTSGARDDEAVLRNVTAVSTGAESTGLKYRLIGQGGSPSLTVDAASVIARGTSNDVVARGLSAPPNTAGTGATVDVSLDHSDYSTTATSTDAGEGGATITPAGSGANIEAQPSLAADGYHEKLGSPTIDVGATDRFSGEADPDGQPRTIGSAADIGADEFTGPDASTHTAVVCAPAELDEGATTHCTATVTEDGDNQTPISGAVSFLHGGAGAFSAEPSCVAEGDGQLSCAIDYVPAAAGSQEIIAIFAGDEDHAFSEGATTITVVSANRNDTETALTCDKNRLPVGASTSCTATVTDRAAAGSASNPSGEISFSDETESGTITPAKCSLSPVGENQASCEVDVQFKPTARGEHKLKAAFGDDGGHRPSTGELSVTATAPSELGLSCDSPATTGSPSHCTATVTDISPSGATTPEGKVHFETGGPGHFSASECQLTGTGDSATCAVDYTPDAAGSGSHHLTATYAPTSQHEVASDSFDLTVIQAGNATATRLSCQPTSVILGGASACTATVEDTSGAGASTPSGEVKFQSN